MTILKIELLIDNYCGHTCQSVMCTSTADNQHIYLQRIQPFAMAT